MRVMFSINADEAGAPKAAELKQKIENLCKEYELEGSVRGEGYAKGASYTGTYQIKKKKDKTKPKYDPSQYPKPEKKVKKEKKDKAKPKYDPSQYPKPEKKVKKEKTAKKEQKQENQEIQENQVNPE